MKQASIRTRRESTVYYLSVSDSSFSRFLRLTFYPAARTLATKSRCWCPSPPPLPKQAERKQENKKEKKERKGGRKESRESKRESLPGGPVNLYPEFLLWPGCGSLTYGWGQDHPTGLRTLDLAGFGKLSCPSSVRVFRVYVSRIGVCVIVSTVYGVAVDGG